MKPPASTLALIIGRFVVALLLACASQFLVSSAMAQGHGHGGGRGDWHGGGWRGGWYGGIGPGWGWPYYWDWPYYGYGDYPPPPVVYPAPTTAIPAPVPATPAAPASWYYCANPKGYYPYVQSCKGP